MNNHMLIAIASAGWGHAKLQEILGLYSCIEEAWEDNFSKLPRLRKSTVEKIKTYVHNAEYKTVVYSDQDFPRSVLSIPNHPLVLWYQGDLSIAKEQSISIVGSRAITPNTDKYLHSIIPSIVNNSLVTVSGLALGVDAVVHAVTLEQGGRTVAVLGSGIDEYSFSPKTNSVLRTKIVECGGLILTQFPPGTQATNYTFPLRNAIVAALSRTILVAQAASKSGSLITASLGKEFNKIIISPSVDYFEPSVAGNRELIASGCEVSVGTGDILQHYQIIQDELGFDNAAEIMSFETLCTKLGIDPKKESHLLTVKELHGEVRNLGNGMWELCKTID